MTAQEYVSKFKLAQENYEFNRSEFIDAFSLDFLESIKKHPNKNPKTGTVYYYEFKKLVKRFEALFWEISQLKVGKALSKGLWNAFFVKSVVEYRAKHYPRIQNYIEGIRKSQANKTGQNG